MDELKKLNKLKKLKKLSVRELERPLDLFQEIIDELVNNIEIYMKVTYDDVKCVKSDDEEMKIYKELMKSESITIPEFISYVKNGVNITCIYTIVKKDDYRMMTTFSKMKPKDIIDALSFIISEVIFRDNAHNYLTTLTIKNVLKVLYLLES